MHSLLPRFLVIIIIISSSSSSSSSSSDIKAGGQTNSGLHQFFNELIAREMRLEMLSKLKVH